MAWDRTEKGLLGSTSPAAVGGKLLLRSVPDKRETTRPEPKWINCSQVDSSQTLNKHRHLTHTSELSGVGRGRLWASPDNPEAVG